MMADSVEAASRSLKKFDKESMDKLVDGLIEYQKNEGQFDNAAITLKDITAAKRALKIAFTVSIISASATTNKKGLDKSRPFLEIYKPDPVPIPIAQLASVIYLCDLPSWSSEQPSNPGLHGLTTQKVYPISSYPESA